MMELWNGQQAAWRLSFEFETKGTQPGAPGGFLSAGISGGNSLVTGLGPQQEFSAAKARRAAAFAAKKAKELGVQSAVVELAPMAEALGAETAVAAATEGMWLAQFVPQSWKHEEPKELPRLYVNPGASPAGKEAIESVFLETTRLAEAVLFARNLVNEPANLLTPESMAARMWQQASACGVQAEVMDEAQIEALGMEAFLTVGSSAAHPPRLIVLRHNGNPQSSQRIALVGKGVTCDTGGYCLKPASSMKGIKGDMAGAAAVCGAILALARQNVKVNAVAVIPAAENRISPGSFIPGDVIGSMAGKSIEIGNTDAEGRLMLADAVTYALQKEGATCVVDIATLTGAVVAMFGFTTAGVLGNHDELYNVFSQAAAQAGEQYWRLPIFPEYKKMIESPIADVSNVSNDGCGTITAGLFIGSFVGETPWLHMDIAGTAWVDTPKWEYQSKGATGAGVTTLYHLCKSLASKGNAPWKTM